MPFIHHLILRLQALTVTIPFPYNRIVHRCIALCNSLIPLDCARVTESSERLGQQWDPPLRGAGYESSLNKRAKRSPLPSDSPAYLLEPAFRDTNHIIPTTPSPNDFD